jgi:hypothetical protein
MSGCAPTRSVPQASASPCPPDWRRYCEKPGGCEITRCGDDPDEFCKEEIPRCGDKPDEFRKEGEVPPPPQKDQPKEGPSDAPL